MDYKTDNGFNDKNTNGGKKKNTALITVIALIVVLLIAVIVLLIVLLNKKNSAEVLNPNAVAQGAAALTYDTNATAVDEESLQDAVDKMVESVEEGQMELDMKVTATSTDGKHFSCQLNNSEQNKYDMYMGIYSDGDFQDELLLTGLIKPGQGIDSFETERKLDPGQYECYLVYTQVEDDHVTAHAQVVVTITLNVSEA